MLLHRQWKNNKNTFAVNYQHNFNKITRSYLIATYNPRLNEESFLKRNIKHFWDLISTFVNLQSLKMTNKVRN